MRNKLIGNNDNKYLCNPELFSNSSEISISVKRKACKSSKFRTVERVDIFVCYALNKLDAVKRMTPPPTSLRAVLAENVIQNTYFHW